MRRPSLSFLSSNLISEHSRLLHTLAQPGRHERALHGLFNGRLGFEGEKPEFARPLIIVAFTNRSGSNLVCDYLSQTGRIGGAGEFLNHDEVARRVKAKGLDNLPDYVRNLVAEFAGPHKALAIKASWDQLAMLLRARIPSMFPKTYVLHCQRNDTLAQAVSYAIALRTGRWISRQAGNGTQPSELMADPPLKEIERQIDYFHRANLLIRLLCDAHELRRWDIGYERLCQDKGAHLAIALRAAELVARGWLPSTPKLEQQAGPVNSELAAAFLARVRAGAGK